MTLLRRVSLAELERTPVSPLLPEAVERARGTIVSVAANGEPAIREYAERFQERGPGDPLVLGPADMHAALAALPIEDRRLLERVAERIGRFAQAQRDSIASFDLPIAGGIASQVVVPVESAGCYAPAGRSPLPSSVLMTAVTARVAGCSRVVVASPGAHPIMLAAAAVAEADEFLAIGGAHAIAALAYGFDGFAPVAVVVGPGNAWVTAAKHLVSDRVGIDMLAGPSELLVLADESADPSLIAADLLAQAEHDPMASAMLAATSEPIVEAVERELVQQLESLPTREVAQRALANGFACVVRDQQELVRVADRVAAEHLEILTAEAEALARQVRHAGGVFIGPGSAEVLGDFGAGPNHTLPTGGTARHTAGLSVLDFLRARTHLSIADPAAANELAADAVQMAELEGLPAHARAAQRRIQAS